MKSIKEYLRFAYRRNSKGKQESRTKLPQIQENKHKEKNNPEHQLHKNNM